MKKEIMTKRMKANFKVALSYLLILIGTIDDVKVSLANRVTIAPIETKNRIVDEVTIGMNQSRCIWISGE